MRDYVENSIKASHSIARTLSEMVVGIGEIKKTGGLDDKTKLEAILGFKERAADMLEVMGEGILKSLDQLRLEAKPGGEDSTCSISSGDTACSCGFCGEVPPVHAPGCQILLDIKDRC